MVILKPHIRPKNKHIQSFLASSKFRLRRLKNNNPVIDKEQETLINTSIATLQGFYTPNKNPRQLTILLHGWEGSARSTYIQLLANRLYQDGHSIFRLNFRDHGNTHQLNQGLFHSCLLTEVVESVCFIKEKYQYEFNNLIGFSLGGNFALRIASHTDTQCIWHKIFSICPPINPKNSMHAISKSYIYSNYFLNKWKKSLRIKAGLFPELFERSHWEKERSLEKLTETLILKHTEYQTTDAYFSGYAITPKIVANIKSPTHVLTSWDDPVIPFTDFNTIDKIGTIQIKTSPFGGHCGFIQGLSMHSWLEDYIINETRLL